MRRQPNSKSIYDWRCLIWLAACLLLGCSEPASSFTSDAGLDDGGEQDAAVDRMSHFWSVFSIEGIWAEYFPTLAKMAESADVVAVVTVSAVAARTIDVGDPLDNPSEAIFTLSIEDAVRGADSLSSLTLTMTPGYRLSDQSVAILNGLLPIDPFLVLVRERTDFPGTYRLVNDYGLWARTERGDVDCPVVRELTDDFCFYREELMGVQSVHELAERLRP
jgi:hypothetical protein